MFWKDAVEVELLHDMTVRVDPAGKTLAAKLFGSGLFAAEESKRILVLLELGNGDIEVGRFAVSARESTIVGGKVILKITLKSAKADRREAQYEGRSAMQWVAMLKGGDNSARGKAAYALAEIRSAEDEVLDALSAALLDQSSEVVQFSALALARAGDAGIPPLITGLKSAKDELREYCAVALSTAGAPAVKPLIRLLSSPNKTSVATACGVLGRIGKPAIPDLVIALKHEESQVRAFALLAIGRMGGAAKEAIPKVKERLQDSHQGVRAAAADTLAKIDN